MRKSLDLDRQIESAQNRLQQIQARAEDKVEPNSLLVEAIAELSIALEELQVAVAELHQQNEELLAARQSMEEERQRYQNLFDFAPDAYLVTDSQGVIQAINGAAEALLDIRRDRAQNKPLILFVAAADHGFIYDQLDRVAQLVQQAAGRAKTQSARRKRRSSPSQTTICFQDREVAVKLRQQPALPTSLSLSVEFDRQGKVVGLYWLFRDLRERKQLETELRRREQQFTSLVENSPDIIFRLDRQLRHTYISPRVTEVSGLFAQDFLGKTGRELGLPADACDAFEAACREAIATGEVTRVEYTIGDRHYVSRLIPERSADGAIESLMGITEDITERHQLEQQLQTYTANLEHLYHDAPCGYHSLDAEGTFVRINDTELAMLGYSREEIVGKKRFPDLLTPESKDTYEQNFPQFKQRGGVRDLEVQMIRKDGTILPVSVSGTAVKDAAGNYLFSRSVVIDISDRQLAEAAIAADLRDTQRLHDLSTRLTGESDIQAFYDEIVTTAIALMHADAGSLQILDRSRNELQLQACQGFHPDAAAFWQRVGMGAGSTCSTALERGERTIVPDIETCDLMAGTADLDYYRLCGIRAVQSSPLLSRSGQSLGMFSTHWHEPYQPSDRELRFLDLLARQAADLLEQRQAEAALHESEEKLQLFVRCAPASVAMFDRNMHYVAVSQRWVDVYHLGSIEAVLGRSHYEVFPTIPDRWRQVHQQGLAGISQACDEDHFILPDGTVQWSKWEVQPWHLETGAVGGILIFVEDITDRKRREANAAVLAEIAEDFSHLLSSEEIIQTVGEKLKAHLHITACNFCEIDEVRDEVIYFGRWNTEEAPRLPDRICLSEQISEEFRRRIRTGETIVSDNTQTNPVTNAQANASIGVLSFVTVPFHQNGAWKYLFSVHDNRPHQWHEDEIELVREVANRTFPRLERARAEFALRETQQQLQAILDNSPAIIYAIDRQNQHLLVNRSYAELLSTTPEALIGQSIYEVWPAETANIFAANNQLVIQGDRLVETEEVVPQADGLHTYITLKFPLHDVDGNPYAICGISTDITARKQAELALQQQLQREQTLAEISQEIRRSLHLNQVLSRTVEKVRELLHTDRAIVFRFRPDGQGDVIVESVAAGFTPILSTTIFDPCFSDRYLEPYRQGRFAAVEDIEAEGIEPCYVELLQQFQVRANLVAPILVGEKLWGLLIVHHCSAPRPWEPAEIDLLRQLSVQVGIAIQQSQLYEQTHQELVERQQMQAVLAESEERFRSLSAAAPIGICQTNADGICLYTNARWQEMSGLGFEDCLGNGWLQTIHPEDRETLFTAWNAFLQGESDCLPEFRLLPPHGEIHWVSARVATMKSATGEIIGHVSSYEDITDRKLAEMALRQQLERERLLAAVSNQIHQTLDLGEILNAAVSETRQFLQCDRVFIYRFDSDWSGKIVVESVSDRYPPALQAEVEDQYFMETHGEDYRQGRIQAVANVRTAGLTQCHLDMLTQFHIKANLAIPILQGERLWGLLVANQCSAPRVWQPEEIALFQQVATQVGIATYQAELYQNLQTELDDRQLAEEKIREQAALLDIASDAIFVRDLDHRILYWNQGAERLYGWLAAEAIGQRATELLQSDADLVSAIVQTLLEREEWRGELHKVTKTGQPVVVEARWTLVRDEAGQPKFILSVDTDITEKKQLEAQFYQAQRLESLGTLAGGIAHDLNNVLTPILTISQLLRWQMPNLDGESEEMLGMLENSAKRGANMVKQILAFTRGTGGEPIPLQVAPAIAEVVNVIEQTFPKSIAIRTQIPERDLWLVSADPTHLHQVLMNLCVNSRDAMPHGGTLAISAENYVVDDVFAHMNLNAQAGNYVLFTVADTGTGIEPEVRDRIFEPFFTTKPQGEGTGLGLSTVLGIVKTYGGFIQVATEVGNGTQFKVYLPAIEATARESEPTAELLQGHGELVLIADDDPAVQRVTQSLLERHGYTTLVANDGIEAIATYAKHKKEIQAVAIDIMMPNMDGITAIRTMQKMNPQVKVIAMSGLSAQKEPALDAGARVFLAKPYTAEDLLKSLSALVNNRH